MREAVVGSTSGVRRDSLTALSRAGCGEGDRLWDWGPFLWAAHPKQLLGVWVGTLALTALCAHLCGAM